MRPGECKYIGYGAIQRVLKIYSASNKDWFSLESVLALPWAERKKLNKAINQIVRAISKVTDIMSGALCAPWCQFYVAPDICSLQTSHPLGSVKLRAARVPAAQQGWIFSCVWIRNVESHMLYVDGLTCIYLRISSKYSPLSCWCQLHLEMYCQDPGPGSHLSSPTQPGRPGSRGTVRVFMKISPSNEQIV